jgi:uroporphyrin-III C-methyltransferase
MMKNNKQPKIGKVYLIGAGPGDPELLTLKAVRALKEAEIALVDALVDSRVLEHLSPDCQILDVGKRGGRKSHSQAEIHSLITAGVEKGLTVARIKGGDPFVFGRGGEELEMLQELGIPVEIVAGITAGTALPAAAGIYLTHRDLAQSVTFVTGRTAENGIKPDWSMIAKLKGTTVIYMGLSSIDCITEQLLAAGRSQETPVAVIENGTLQNERTVLSRLGRLAEDVRRSAVVSPALFVIGEVVEHLHQKNAGGSCLKSEPAETGALFSPLKSNAAREVLV